MELADAQGMPKPETRNPKETRTPKAEHAPGTGRLRISAFGPPSDLGLRDSDLYTPRTLRSELSQRGPLPLDECIQFGLALTSALAHLHQHGLVHRDVKPSNIIVVNGQPKLADVGLVTEVSDAHSRVGTVGFIPPEGPGTPQADLHSLGKVLYELSTGKDRQQFPQLPLEVESRPDHDRWLELNEVILRAGESDPRRRCVAGRDSDGFLSGYTR